MKKKKVIVGMSGGLDSSVTAALLKDEGYDVSGVIMAIYDDSLKITEESRHACFGPGEKEDIEDARSVADQLDFNLHVVDLKKEYRKIVLEPFIKGYKSGSTPNPCITCNRFMKFGAILSSLENRGIPFDYFATGHYAKISYNEPTNRYHLEKPEDLTKDQTYFLYFLQQNQLNKLLFPLWKYTKGDVRKLAENYNLHVSDKPESQDFVAGGYHQLFDQSKNPGHILNTDGEIIGTHDGVDQFTVGQRKGIGISSSEPLYVISKNACQNTITVGYQKHLYKDVLTAGHLNWIQYPRLEKRTRSKAKIRYLHHEADVIISPVENDRVVVRFDTPQRAITPGQSVVFYNDRTVMGGGIILEEKQNEY